MTQKFIPLGNNVLLSRAEKQTKTAGGLIIPDSAQEKPSEATVEAVGDGIRDANGNLVPMSVRTGDTVLISKWAGTEVAYDNQNYLIAKESDILGIILKKAN